MNRRSFLLGVIAAVLPPVVPVPARAVGFHPALAMPYASGGFIPGDAYRDAKALFYARGYSASPALLRAMEQRGQAVHLDRWIPAVAEHSNRMAIARKGHVAIFARVEGQNGPLKPQAGRSHLEVPNVRS